MKKLIILLLIGLLSLGNFFVMAQDGGEGSQQKTDEKSECKGIKLNTKVPFVSDGDGCIERKSDSGSTFGELMGGMSKLVINIIMIVSFLSVVIGGLLMTLYGFDSGSYNKGKQLLMKVVVGIILLGLSGIILHMINPSFFTTG